ncbi:MAG TPA: hypothetical protein VGM11_08485 [Acidobacteriaceae bacterium]
MTATHALLRESIDYAGLFPPAALDLDIAVSNYAAYRAGRDSWALGRLVLPASKLAELAHRWPEHVRDWPISLLLGPDFLGDMQLAAGVGLRPESVECRPAQLDDIRAIRALLRTDAELFVEAGPGIALDDLLATLHRVGACAKIRTGGVTPDAIPTVGDVAAFLCACARRGVRLKATAGLHHVVRAEHPLTYAADAPRANMHGFLNFFVSSMLAMRGEENNVESCLRETSTDAFQTSEDRITWRDKQFALDEIERMRANFALSFGSCSFEEPIADLRAMGWLA